MAHRFGGRVDREAPSRSGQAPARWPSQRTGPCGSPAVRSPGSGALIPRRTTPRRSRSARHRAASSPRTAGSGRAQGQPRGSPDPFAFPAAALPSADGPQARALVGSPGCGRRPARIGRFRQSARRVQGRQRASAHVGRARLLDPALANGLVGSWALLNATCAKLFRIVYNAERNCAGRSRGRGRRPEDHERRPHVHLRPEADVPLPHRRARDRTELRRRVHPRRQPEAEVTGGTPGLPAGDRRG